MSHEKGALFQEGQLGLILVTEVSLNSNKGWFHGKKVVVFFILSKLPPLPLIWTTCTTFFERQNVDLSDIQNDSLSKIIIKLRQNTCFVGHVYNLKKQLKVQIIGILEEIDSFY